MADREREKLQREDWDGFLKEFQGESDRAAAIVGAAFLDEHLRFLLEEFLVDDPESRNLLEGALRGVTVRARANIACIRALRGDLFGALEYLEPLFSRNEQWRKLARLDPDLDLLWKRDLFQRVLFPSPHRVV